VIEPALEFSSRISGCARLSAPRGFRSGNVLLGDFCRLLGGCPAMIFRLTNKKGAQSPLVPEQTEFDQAFLAQATQ
jgi:hypothetical protein